MRGAAVAFSSLQQEESIPGFSYRQHAAQLPTELTLSLDACLRLSTCWHSVWAQIHELQRKQTSLPYSPPLQPVFFWPPENII